jgi:hypothetical protein
VGEEEDVSRAWGGGERSGQSRRRCVGSHPPAVREVSNLILWQSIVEGVYDLSHSCASSGLHS